MQLMIILIKTNIISKILIKFIPNKKLNNPPTLPKTKIEYYIYINIKTVRKIKILNKYYNNISDTRGPPMSII